MSGVRFRFRLYTAGRAPNSVRALSNLQRLCEEHLPGQHAIEVIDVVADPGRALADGVVLTPLLVRVSPPPTAKVLGNLAERDWVVELFGLTATEA